MSDDLGFCVELGLSLGESVLERSPQRRDFQAELEEMLRVHQVRIWESRGRAGVQGGPRDEWEGAEGQGGVFLRSPAGHRVDPELAWEHEAT